MTTSIVLRVGKGSFEHGFQVSLQVLENGCLIRNFNNCSPLPSAPHLPQAYEEWQQKYSQLGQNSQLGQICQVEPVEEQNTHFSTVEPLQDCQASCNSLKQSLRNWFCSDSFESLRYRIEAQVGNRNAATSLPVIIDVDTGIAEQDTVLRKLPWDLWDVFSLNNAEPVLSAKVHPPIAPLRSPVKILAIFGSDEGGLELQEDLEALNQLQQYGAVIQLEIEPSRQALSDLLWDKPWDVLFFAGHSSSQEGHQNGYLQIVGNQTIELDGLEADLEQAVEQGLKLAIFNSCDGLGIANYLANLNVPSMIVMREPVPDFVARKFLRYFLEAFSRGKPLYLAVRRARGRLQALETCQPPYPAASWLPIVCQNPAQPELIWPTPTSPDPIPEPKERLWRRLPLGLRLALLVVAGVVMFVAASFIIPHIFPPPPRPPINVESRISLGEKILSIKTAEKRAGSEAFARGDYQEAEKLFEASLQRQRNDPEAVIYQNNAKVIASDDRQSLRIAVSVPIGSNSNVAQELLRGVAQAQDEINTNGGIKGAGLVVAIADDDNDSDIAKQVATAFVEDDKILAVVGHNASDASLAAAPIYQQGKLVMVTPTSFANELSGFGDYIFRTVPHVRLMAARLAEYAVRIAQKPDIAVCYDSQAPDNVSFKDEFIAALSAVHGRLVPIVCNISSPTFNASNAIAEALSNQAKGLMFSPHIDRIPKGIELARANQNKLALFGSSTLYTYETLNEGRENVNGLVLTATWHPQMNLDSPFAKDATRLWGGDGTWRTANSYDALRAISAGFQQSNTRSGLQQALRDPGFYTSGASGSVQFDSAGDRKMQPQLIQVQKSNHSRSKTGYDFVWLE